MPSHATYHQDSAAMIACRDACTACAQICSDMLFAHCLEVGGDHAHADHIRIMTDCTEICRTAADFLTRRSPQHAVVCRACASVCQACADSCRQLGDMDHCVDACEHCYATCRAMAESAS